MGYDTLADGYDQRYTRPVDRWEDDRLAGLLRPDVDGRNVLDLGCGTGWLLDHLAPGKYLGVDESAAMLDRLQQKWPDVEVLKQTVGAPGWADHFPYRYWDTVVATWAGHYFPDLGQVLADVREVVKPGGVIILHGYLPRVARRRHSIEASTNEWRPLGRAAVWSASMGAQLPDVDPIGLGALPDRLAFSHRLWRWAEEKCPAGWCYSALWRWQV